MTTNPAPEPRPVTGVGADVGLSTLNEVEWDAVVTAVEADDRIPAWRTRAVIQHIFAIRLAALRAEPDSVDDDTAGLRAALERVRALGDGWVGFDDSHHFGDAVLAAIGPEAFAALAAADPAGDDPTPPGRSGTADPGART